MWYGNKYCVWVILLFWCPFLLDHYIIGESSVLVIFCEFARFIWGTNQILHYSLSHRNLAGNPRLLVVGVIAPS